MSDMENKNFIEQSVEDMVAEHDRKNLSIIDNARINGDINDDAAKYLSQLYSNGMKWFGEVFYFLGKCFGAPKAPVLRYDYENDRAIEERIRISDIHPLMPYIVHHRLDADPMRNQFFSAGDAHKIDLSVSSIVTVIVGAQKNINRALDKITGKYYKQYLQDVLDTTAQVLTEHGRNASVNAVCDKIREKFESQFITNAAAVVLGIIGSGHENISVDLVRSLDKIVPVHRRLKDVWRVKCLFDLVPQARFFIERVREVMPDRVLGVRDSFYNVKNQRNYRDAKLIINIGTADHIVPMEIICQVRTFFEFERQTHIQYEHSRKDGVKNAGKFERIGANIHECGVREYNLMICQCLDDLFDRVGWNMLYNQDGAVTIFDGFPKNCTMHYPQKIFDAILDKLDNAIENEVFHIINAPVRPNQVLESEIFHFMARFILVAAMPYLDKNWSVPSDTMAGKLFNFVMTEVQRYYNNEK